MEQWIRAANQLLEAMPDVLSEINERRYAAEREYSRVKNTQLVHYTSQGDNTVVARSKAELDALEAKQQWDNTRVEFHYAEDTMNALRTKIYSYLNINKAVTTQYQSYR